MKTQAIQQNPNKAHLKEKENPKNKFQKALEKACRTEREEKKNHPACDETPLMDGPVTTILTPSICAEKQKIVNVSSISKSALQIIHELKPKLISISENGVSKTIVQLKGELLSNLEVEIDHYDTNPSQFILTFRGDEKAQQIILANQNQLATSLKGALPNFQFTFAPSTYRTLSSKKKKSSKNSLVKTTKVRYCANKSGV